MTSVAGRAQALLDSPAAIYVITQEDIRRSGHSSIPELLRMVPGLHVARINSSSWAVSARGFNGRFNNKMLVMIDGRTVFNSLFSGVYWDVQDVPLETIERIENTSSFTRSPSMSAQDSYQSTCASWPQS